MTHFKARPTTYNGIRMRSRLEAGYAMWLDQQGFQWEYEPQAFAAESGQYLPDFKIDAVTVSWRPEPVTVYVEVKPDSFEELEELARRMLVIQASEPECECILEVPGEPPSRMIERLPGVTYSTFPWFYVVKWLDAGPGNPPMLGAEALSLPWPPEWWAVK